MFRWSPLLLALGATAPWVPVVAPGAMGSRRTTQARRAAPGSGSTSSSGSGTRSGSSSRARPPGRAPARLRGAVSNFHPRVLVRASGSGSTSGSTSGLRVASSGSTTSSSSEGTAACGCRRAGVRRLGQRLHLLVRLQRQLVRGPRADGLQRHRVRGARVGLPQHRQHRRHGGHRARTGTYDDPITPRRRPRTRIRRTRRWHPIRCTSSKSSGGATLSPRTKNLQPQKCRSTSSWKRTRASSAVTSMRASSRPRTMTTGRCPRAASPGTEFAHRLPGWGLHSSPATWTTSTTARTIRASATRGRVEQAQVIVRSAAGSPRRDDPSLRRSGAGGGVGPRARCRLSRASSARLRWA